MKPGVSVCENVGGAASALVERKTPPPDPGLAPLTPARRLLGLPGSRTMSVMLVFPVPGVSRLPIVVTTSLAKVTEAAADVALVERYRPRRPSGGDVLLKALEPTPEMPAVVATKIVAGSVGCTTIFEMARPVKQFVVICTVVPVVICGFIGPTRIGEVSTLSMR